MNESTNLDLIRDMEQLVFKNRTLKAVVVHNRFCICIIGRSLSRKKGAFGSSYGT